MTDSIRNFNELCSSKMRKRKKEETSEPVINQLKHKKEKSLVVCANRQQGRISKQDYPGGGTFRVVPCFKFAIRKGIFFRGDSRNMEYCLKKHDATCHFIEWADVLVRYLKRQGVRFENDMAVIPQKMLVR